MIKNFLLTAIPGRGVKKFGDECKEDRECGFDGSFCDPRSKKCYCREEYPVTNHIDKCGIREFNFSSLFISWYL